MTTATSQNERGNRGITGAVLLIGLGAAILLGNAGVLDINLLALLPYWPVLLLLFGLDILIGRTAFGGIILTLVAAAAVAGMLYVVSTQPARSIGGTPLDFTEPLGEITALDVELNIGGAAVTIDGTAQPYAAEGTYTLEGLTEPERTYTVEDGIGRMTFSAEDGDTLTLNPGLAGMVDLSLTDAVPLTLTLNVGVGDANLQLGDLLLDALVVNTGVGEVNVQLPPGDYTADISLGVGSISLEVPREAEVELILDGVIVPTLPERFTKTSDGKWHALHSSAAADRITIRVGAGPSAVQVSEYD